MGKRRRFPSVFLSEDLVSVRTDRARIPVGERKTAPTDLRKRSWQATNLGFLRNSAHSRKSLAIWAGFDGRRARRDASSLGANSLRGAKVVSSARREQIPNRNISGEKECSAKNT